MRCCASHDYSTASYGYMSYDTDSIILWCARYTVGVIFPVHTAIAIAIDDDDNEDFPPEDDYLYGVLDILL